MSTIFALDSSFLLNIQPKPYLTNILMVFTQLNPLKIAVDSDGVAVDSYTQVANERDDELIATWITLMSHEPQNFEPIGKVDPNEISSIEFFLRISKEIVGKKQLIVESKQVCKGFTFKGSSIVNYGDTDIFILDRDEAMQKIAHAMSQVHAGSGDNVSGNKIQY